MGDDNPTLDQAAVEDTDGSKIEDNLKSRTTWLRLLFMSVFCVLISLASLVGSVVVLLGFLWVLFNGEVNRQLQKTGQSLASYMYEIVRYLTFNSESKPFPFGADWPSGKTDS